MRRVQPRAQLAAIVAGVLIAVPSWTAGAQDTSSVTVEYVGGIDRYATAVAVAERAYPPGQPPPPGANRIWLARGDDYADALSLGLQASERWGDSDPIMLTRPAVLPDVVAQAILERAAAEEIIEVVLVGGYTAITEDVRAQVEALGVPVRRIFGPDRYETNRGLLALHPQSIGYAVVATGTNFPDALVAGTVSAIAGADLWLTRPDEVPPKAIVDMGDRDATEYIVVGGRSAVSDAVIDQLGQVNGNPTVTRVGGRDRWETAVAIAEELMPRFVATGEEYNLSTVILTRGDKAPDAVVGAQLAGVLVAPMVLTVNPDVLGATTETFLREHAGQIQNIVILGDETAVSPEVADQARRAAEGN